MCYNLPLIVKTFDVIDIYMEHSIDVPMLDDRLPTKRDKTFTKTKEVEVVVIDYRVSEEEHINVGEVPGDGKVPSDGEVPDDAEVHDDGEVVDDRDNEDLD